MKENYIENQYIEIWFENGLVHAVAKPDTILTRAVAETLVETRLKVSNKRTSPILIDFRNVVAADNASRSFMASSESQKYLSAGAILINNQIHKLLMNLWLKIDKPVI